MSLDPTRDRRAHRLLQLGVTLFLLGLLTGFGLPLMANPRMGLSSHLEGVMNGGVLVVLGLLWDRLSLGERALSVTFWAAVYGTFANWATTLAAAAWGAGAMMPLAAGEHRGTAFQEGLIAFGLWSLSLSMVLVSVLLLVGLGGRSGADETPGSVPAAT